jgi:hypothetical protein
MKTIDDSQVIIENHPSSVTSPTLGFDWSVTMRGDHYETAVFFMDNTYKYSDVKFYRFRHPPSFMDVSRAAQNSYEKGCVLS